MPLFGGNWINQRTEKNQLNNQTGICCVPHASTDNTDGSQVFVFFQANDINKPIYFAAAQSGAGWFSQHPNQFVLQTDNVRVRIDEQTNDLVYQKYGTAVNKSSCFFTSFNSKCQSSHQVRTTKKTLVDIQVQARNDIGINLIVNGDVNIQINGNKYQQINGDIYETHIGNRYIRHEGQTIIQNSGKYTLYQIKQFNIQVNGKTNLSNYGGFNFIIQNSDVTNFNFDGDCTVTLNGPITYTYCGDVIENYAVSETKNINSTLTINANNYSINANNLQTITINSGKTIFNDTVSIKTGITGIITLTNMAHVVDGIVIGLG